MNPFSLEDSRRILAAAKNDQETDAIINSIQGSDVSPADLVLYKVETENGLSGLLAMVFPSALAGSGVKLVEFNDGE